MYHCPLELKFCFNSLGFSPSLMIYSQTVQSSHFFFSLEISVQSLPLQRSVSPGSLEAPGLGLVHSQHTRGRAVLVRNMPRNISTLLSLSRRADLLLIQAASSLPVKIRKAEQKARGESGERMKQKSQPWSGLRS